MDRPPLRRRPALGRRPGEGCQWKRATGTPRGAAPHRTRRAGTSPRSQAAQFPNLTALAGRFAAVDPDERFELLLGIFVDGLAQHAAAR